MIRKQETTTIDRISYVIAEAGVNRGVAVAMATRIEKLLGRLGYVVIPATNNAEICRDGTSSKLVIRGLSAAQATEAINAIYENISGPEDIS